MFMSDCESQETIYKRKRGEILLFAWWIQKRSLKVLETFSCDTCQQTRERKPAELHPSKPYGLQLLCPTDCAFRSELQCKLSPIERALLKHMQSERRYIQYSIRVLCTRKEDISQSAKQQSAFKGVARGIYQTIHELFWYLI